MKSKCLDPIYMDLLQRQVYGGKVAGCSLVKTYSIFCPSHSSTLYQWFADLSRHQN